MKERVMVEGRGRAGRGSLGRVHRREGRGISERGIPGGQIQIVAREGLRFRIITRDCSHSAIYLYRYSV